MGSLAHYTHYTFSTAGRRYRCFPHVTNQKKLSAQNIFFSLPQSALLPSILWKWCLCNRTCSILYYSSHRQCFTTALVLHTTSVCIYKSYSKQHLTNHLLKISVYIILKALVTSSLCNFCYNEMKISYTASPSG